MDQYRYALASIIIVGLGQVIKGEAEKGIKFILLFYFTLPAIIYTSLIVSGPLFLMALGVGIIFAIIFWGYNVADAYQAASK